MQRQHIGFTTLQLISLGIMTFATTPASAAGFALIEQSASQMGNAFAGANSAANDATTIYFNPAGLTRIRQQLVVGVHAVKTSAKFDGDATDILGRPINGGNGGDAGTTGIIPNLYYALPLENNITLGLGINVPYGLKTKYDNNWKGRYQAIKSEVTTINVNPSIGYKVNKDFSVGFGISAQYIDAELTQKIDQNSLCIGQALAAGASLPAAGAACAGVSDAEGKVSGNDWSMGFNFGLMFQPTPDTRIGASYRSKVKHNLKGNGRFKGASPLFTTRDVFVRSDINAKLDLPQTVSLGVYHDINTQWSVMGDATWTGWSSFEELRINYRESNQPDTVTDQSWNNNMRYALGADYRHNSSWVFRAGVALDKTPIPGDSKRTARIPGGERIWTSVGFGYRWNTAINIDVGYSHLFVDDPGIDNTSTTGGNIVGEYAADVDILSAQVVWDI